MLLKLSFLFGVWEVIKFACGRETVETKINASGAIAFAFASVELPYFAWMLWLMFHDAPGQIGGILLVARSIMGIGVWIGKPGWKPYWWRVDAALSALILCAMFAGRL